MQYILIIFQKESRNMEWII